MRHYDTPVHWGYEGPRVPHALKARNAPARLYRGLATASKKPRDERQPSAPGNEERGLPWYKQSGAFQRRAAVNHQLRWPFARGDGDLPLPKPVRNAILASKWPGLWRMSDWMSPARVP